MEVTNELQTSLYSCQDCRMVFNTAKQLQIHKDKFCIGSDIGDPFLLKKGALKSRKKQSLSQVRIVQLYLIIGYQFNFIARRYERIAFADRLIFR